MTSDSDVVRTATAFKHPQCGGLVWMVEKEDRTYFQCDTCLEISDHLEQLAVGKPVILRRRKQTETEWKEVDILG